MNETPRDKLFQNELADPERLKLHLGRLVTILDETLDKSKSYLVYILAQNSRMGHLGSEPWYINTLLGPTYENIVIVTAPRKHAANGALFDYFKEQFIVIESDDIILTTMGFIDFGAFGLENYDFYFRSPQTLIKEFSRAMAEGMPHRFFEMPAGAVETATDFRKNVLSDDVSRPFVFLHVRDSGFAPEMPYHSYRFNDVFAYRAGVELLLRKGYSVLRTGDPESPELDIDHPHYFEIMRHPKYSRDIDFFLASNAAFGILNQSGPLTLFQAFGLPHLLTNAYPISAWVFLDNELAVYKHHFTEDGKRLCLSELIQAKTPMLGTTEAMAEAGLRTQANNSSEILAGIEDMLDFIEDGATPDQDIQKKFYEITAEFDPSVRGKAAEAETNRRLQHRLSTRFVEMTPGFLA